MRYRLHAGGRPITPFFKIGEQHAGLVAQLVAPALRNVGIHQLVPLGLHQFAERSRADHADIQFDGLQPVAEHALRHAADVQPRRPWPVEQLRLRYRDALGCVEILAEKKSDMHFAQVIGDAFQRAARRCLQQTLDHAVGIHAAAKLDTVGVIAVGAVAQAVVLDVNLQLAGGGFIALQRRWVRGEGGRQA